MAVLTLTGTDAASALGATLLLRGFTFLAADDPRRLVDAPPAPLQTGHRHAAVR